MNVHDGSVERARAELDAMSDVEWERHMLREIELARSNLALCGRSDLSSTRTVLLARGSRVPRVFPKVQSREEAIAVGLIVPSFHSRAA
jgi:hypothetical protein